MPVGLGRKGRVTKRKTRPPVNKKACEKVSNPIEYDRDEQEPMNENEDEMNSSSLTKLGDAVAADVKVPNTTTGFRLVDLELLLKFVLRFPCRYCMKFGLGVVDEYKQGMYSMIRIQCHICDKIFPLKTCGRTPNGFEANVRFVGAVYEMGGHRSMGQKFCTEMNMPPPPARNSWYATSEKIGNAASVAAQENMDFVANDIKTKVEVENPGQGKVSEITVSCDGTWQRRGFSSRNGVATVLTVDGMNRKVIDTVTLSNHCDACMKKKKKCTDEEFLDWQVGDHGARCQKNYDGSAGSMEPTGMDRIFRRSEAKYKLQYTGYLGDGDSKIFTNLKNADTPIYQDKELVKLECCGHIQKKMYNRLKKVATNCKNKVYKHQGKSHKGIQGKGLLTDKQIKKMQGHYGSAIRENAGNLSAMQRAVWNIFYHRNGEHEQCPDW